MKKKVTSTKKTYSEEFFTSTPYRKSRGEPLYGHGKNVKIKRTGTDAYGYYYKASGKKKDVRQFIKANDLDL